MPGFGELYGHGEAKGWRVLGTQEALPKFVVEQGQRRAGTDPWDEEEYRGWGPSSGGNPGTGDQAWRR